MATVAEVIEQLKRAIEHAPRDPGQVSDQLAGWCCDSVDVCAKCAGRIIARGCQLPRPSEPVWKPEMVHCVLCLQDSSAD